MLRNAFHTMIALSAALAYPSMNRADDGFRIFDGKPTRLFFTGNPHHPTFGQEKLVRLLDRYFEGKSPIRVEGLPDGRKDPFTGQAIKPAKVSELHRFLEPVLKAQRPKDELLVVLSYVIVEEPRTKKSPTWVKEGADDLEKYGKDALARGVKRMFLAEMVQPDHIPAGLAGNKFRRAGLQVFDALMQRKVAGIERGPRLQERMEKQVHFFTDGRHFSLAGKDFIGCLWFESLLQHDGLPVPAWCRDEIAALLKANK